MTPQRYHSTLILTVILPTSHSSQPPPGRVLPPLQPSSLRCRQLERGLASGERPEWNGASKAEGGNILVEGGVYEGEGYESGCYVKPAIVEAKNSYEIVQHETFAPILASISPLIFALGTLFRIH